MGPTAIQQLGAVAAVDAIAGVASLLGRYAGTHHITPIGLIVEVGADDIGECIYRWQRCAQHTTPTIHLVFVAQQHVPNVLINRPIGKADLLTLLPMHGAVGEAIDLVERSPCQKAPVRIELIGEAQGHEGRVGIRSVSELQRAAGPQLLFEFARTQPVKGARDGLGFAARCTAGAGQRTHLFKPAGQTQSVAHLKGVANTHGRLHGPPVNGVGNAVLIVDPPTWHIGTLHAH